MIRTALAAAAVAAGRPAAWHPAGIMWLAAFLLVLGVIFALSARTSRKEELDRFNDAAREWLQEEPR